MELNNCVLIAITQIAEDVVPTKKLRTRLRAAMQDARKHWAITNEDDEFRAAIGAVLVKATDDEKTRINNELQVLKALNAGGNINGVDLGENPIGLLKLWKETA